jgi:hypothetical protein
MQDIVWLTPSGQEMTSEDWGTDYARSLGVFLNGGAITEPGRRGEAVLDDDFLLLLNAHTEQVTFVLPGFRLGAVWELMIDTSAAAGGDGGSGGGGGGAGGGGAGGAGGGDGGGELHAGSGVRVAGHAMMVLRCARTGRDSD